MEWEEVEGGKREDSGLTFFGDDSESRSRAEIMGLMKSEKVL